MFIIRPSSKIGQSALLNKMDTRAKNRILYTASDSDTLVQLQNNYIIIAVINVKMYKYAKFDQKFTMQFKSNEDFHQKTSTF